MQKVLGKHMQRARNYRHGVRNHEARLLTSGTSSAPLHPPSLPTPPAERNHDDEVPATKEVALLEVPATKEVALLEVPVAPKASGGEEAGDVVLVTGGSGFLGQHVVSQLQQSAPHVREIRVLDLRPFVQKLDYQATKPVVAMTGSITDPDVVLKATQNVDSVFHIAGLVSYGTFPDVKGMESVNVNGTLNILRACQQQNVRRLVFCSTVDVVVGFTPIQGGTEENTRIPEKFLFPGYPVSKLQAEHLVIASNGQKTRDDGHLHTVSLRANVMYGELDPYYVTSGLRSAKSWGGKLVQVGNGKSLFQQCYVGNVAAAFVQADAVLHDNINIGGEVFYVPDETPIQNSFKFMKPYLNCRGYTLSQFYLPFTLVYGTIYFLELVLSALSPLIKLRLGTQSCSVKYINMDLYFKSNKARRRFDFHPVFSVQEAQKRSTAYYKTVQL